MNRVRLRTIIREIINEDENPEIDLQTALKAFDAKTKNEFKLSKYKFSSSGIAKLNPKDFGLWGQLIKSVDLVIASKGKFKKYSYYVFDLRWEYHSRGRNGHQIGTVYINNENSKEIIVKLEDGRHLK